jgi:hypothetical protein
MDEHVYDPLLYVTARISVGVFLLAFTAAPLRKLLPKVALARWLGDHTRHLILAFVLSHVIHLCVIGALAVKLGGEEFLRDKGVPVMVLGGIIYLFILGLLLTSIRKWPLPPRAERFQSVALYVVGATLFRPLLMRTFEWKAWYYLLFTLAFVAAFTLRILVAVRDKATPAAQNV